MTGAGARSLIEPDIDAYGSRARASALADYWEVAALHGIHLTRAALQDIIVENEWVSRPRRQFFVPDIDEDPTTWVDAVLELLAERERQLGDAYPFEERRRSLAIKAGVAADESSPYLSVLAISVIHAWKIDTSVPVESTFEEMVSGCLRELGLQSVNLGATDRGSGFVEALHTGARSLDLMPMDDPVPRSRSAKDIGVDTLAGVFWRDSRPAGHWIMIGQVTVAQSQEWAKKIREPEPPRWASYLQERLQPQVFLAVPYHAEREHIQDMLFGQQGVLIDRLRLVRVKSSNSASESRLVRIMLDADVS